MLYDNFILTTHTFSIAILLVMALLLCIATHFKGESSYAALVILLTTLSNYIYYICDILGFQNIALLIAPIAYSANLTLLPFMLLLAHRTFNPYYRFKWRILLHFLPATVFAILVAYNISTMSIEEIASFTITRTAGFHSLLTSINFLIIVVQLIIYYYFIFSYLRKVKRYIFNTRSEANLSSKVWIPRFITLIGILIIIAMICSMFDPFDSFQLFYLINVVAMGFILHSELKIVHNIRNHKVPTPDIVSVIEADFIATNMESQPKTDSYKEEDIEQFKLFAQRAEDYLSSSEAYVNPHLTLNDIAKAIGISSKNLSRSINSVLGKTFFDLVNGYRVEKSKALLMQKKEKGLTLETIAEQCGFNSQVVYCNVFKKALGMTTTKWLKQNKAE